MDSLAPRVGLEPTTNRLRLPLRFRKERTISSPQRGAGRSWVDYRLGSLPPKSLHLPGYCTAVIVRCTASSPGLAQGHHHRYMLRLP
jgi:hypothetical protein